MELITGAELLIPSYSRAPFFLFYFYFVSLLNRFNSIIEENLQFLWLRLHTPLQFRSFNLSIFVLQVTTGDKTGESETKILSN